MTAPDVPAVVAHFIHIFIAVLTLTPPWVVRARTTENSHDDASRHNDYRVYYYSPNLVSALITNG